MRFILIAGFTQSHQIIYPGTSEAPLHPVSHHPFFPSNQGQPWLQEREAERRTQSPDTGSQSGDEDEDDGNTFFSKFCHVSFISLHKKINIFFLFWHFEQMK